MRCKHCKKKIIEGEDGYYITGCRHYPMEKIHSLEAQKRFIEELRTKEEK